MRIYCKQEIRELVTHLKGDRIGLIAFSGSTFVQCPLTLDYAAVNLFLDDLVVDESDEFSEEESDEPPIPNKSLEQQKSLERDDSANSPEDVNKKES